MFKLGNYEFEVDNAILSASYFDEAIHKRIGSENSQFVWYIDIEMLPQEIPFVVEDNEEFCEEIAPRLYHNNGFSLPVKSWKEIAGTVKNWEAVVNDLGEEAGTLYTFEHEDVTSGKIEFGKRRGHSFDIKWSGKANLYWDEENYENVPFFFEGNVYFEGIQAQCDEISCFEELKFNMKKWIDIDEFDLVSEEIYDINDGQTYQWKLSPLP